jgi:metal-responsive CopG/Arc/MetJ family transcriptional regulator
MTTRVLFSLSDEVMTRFRAIVPHRERSNVIESLLRKELEVRERDREQRLEDVARMVESHPDFVQTHAVAEDVDRVAGEAVE